jgi:hypothetical protein
MIVAVINPAATPIPIVRHTLEAGGKTPGK